VSNQSEEQRLNIEVLESESSFLNPIIEDKDELTRHFGKRKSVFEYKTVHPADEEEESHKGWAVQRSGIKSSRLKRQKSHSTHLEDRVWCLLFKMGFKCLNGSNFKISFVTNGKEDKKQVDVYAEDDEVALVVECKSKRDRGSRSLRQDLRETIALQEYFRKSITQRCARKQPPKVIWIYVTHNIVWSKEDIHRAESGKIHIINERKLQYFEAFIKYIGPAGRFQILGEFLTGQKIPGLKEKRVPAVRGKIGGHVFFSFVSSPRSLLKIAFINHQALKNREGVPAYQRMISDSRIKEIGNFIRDGGYFPTNLLVNFDEAPRFDQISNKDNTDPNIKFGWLTLPAKYRSAWVIDGQHRLFGFSHLGNEHLDQSLFILAFEKLPKNEEADLFVTINHKQRSVPKSLLIEVLSDIRLGDNDPSTALTALCGAVVRSLNDDPNGPFRDRFRVDGIPKTSSQNLTFSEVEKGLKRSGLIGRASKNSISPGPLCGATDKETIERASRVLGSYFGEIKEASIGRWEAGQLAYVSVNPGIRAHLEVISHVISYISHKSGINFVHLDTKDAARQINEFCAPLFEFFRITKDEELRANLSRKFGEGGVKEYCYYLMKIVADTVPNFGTDEFQTWMQQSTSEKIDEYNQFIMKLSERLTDFVIDTLKEIHGTHRTESGELAFWELGVHSDRIRRNAFEKQQKDKADRRKPKEAYLDIVDLAEIAKQSNNWDRFEYVFNNPQSDERKGKKYYLEWLNTFNDVRNTAAHKNQLKTYSKADLDFIEWLRTTVSPKVPE